MQQIKSILIGWVETNDLIHSFTKFIGFSPNFPLYVLYTFVFVSKYCEKFHPQHWLLLIIKWLLITSWGRVDGIKHHQADIDDISAKAYCFG